MQAEQFQAEMEELAGKLRLTHFISDDLTPDSVNDWNRVFGHLTPKQLYHQFAKTAGDVPVRIHVNMSTQGAFTRVKIRHDSLIHQGNEFENEIRFDIRSDRPPVLHGLFLNKGYQSKNIAKRYLRTIVDLLKENGADSMRVGATDVGAYAWAKYGFTPSTPKEWDQLKLEIRRRLTVDRGTVQFKGTQYDISSEIPVIDKILAAEFEDLPDVFPHLTELNRVISQHNGHPLTVGKALLMNTMWNGRLPFDEQHVSFQRFNHYTDGATKDLQREVV